MACTAGEGAEGEETNGDADRWCGWILARLEEPCVNMGGVKEG
jgi:hypothetical protein